MDFLNYIVEEGLVMVPVLFILGEIIKRTELLNNKWIPLVLLVISVGFTPLLLGGYVATNIVQSILVAGATVFGNELIKQSGKEV
uniref:phage holin family protein n=1 Tax=Jeotgalibaca porci TaxID=1868793 RepID=UPI00359FC12E